MDIKQEANLMKLDRLIEERERISKKEFPIPVKELCERYEKLYTGAINDVLREHVLMDQVLPSGIIPLRDDMKVAGVAFTIKSSPSTKIRGEMETRVRMLDELFEHAFCVWDSSGSQDVSLWGEMMTATALRKGAKATVVDGGIRDTRQILEHNFPVFYKYRTSNGSLGRCLITEYQVVIKIGNTLIRPGDIVFGDIDGVVVIPRDIAYEVIVRAEEIYSNEVRIKGWIDKGESVAEIHNKGGDF
jgi:4-hydroxy-4-methyl-2-oxoglutarate aldolase